MITIFYTRFKEKLDSDTFNYYLTRLTPAQQNQVVRYRNWQDAQRSLLGKMLLLTGLKSIGQPSYSLSDLRFFEYQKPWFDHSIDFNISHSGEFVICAINKAGAIGIDVEEVNKIPLEDFTGLFSAAELKAIYKNENDYQPFYTLWTQKEAYLKAIGMGLNVPLNEVEVRNNTINHNNKVWFLRELKLDPGYVCHFCTETVNPEMNITRVDFTHL